METIRGAETEYGFSPAQIILLLELADAKNIYTYSLPEEEDISDESYILAAQDLMARGFLESADKESPVGLQLTPGALDLFESMIDPVRVLEVISAWTGTIPTLIYRGRGSVCTVSRWDSAGGYIGISLLDADRIGGWLEEEGFLPGQPFESIREGQKALRYDPDLEQSRRLLRESLVCHVQEPPSLWAIQENVRSTLKSYGVSPDGRDSLYVFLETDTESWILTGPGGREAGMETTGSEDDPLYEEENLLRAGQDWSIEPDSLEYRETIWRNIL